VDEEGEDGEDGEDGALLEDGEDGCSSVCSFSHLFPWVLIVFFAFDPLSIFLSFHPPFLIVPLLLHCSRRCRFRP
jgi:hypothetical protein